MRGFEGPSLEIYFIFGDQKCVLRLFENLTTNLKTSILFITNNLEHLGCGRGSGGERGAQKTIK